ncbi:MAG: transposase [Sulfurospirillaceae bacterium]|nr:transposase [Sulfurospirillaceae bacterium]
MIKSLMKCIFCSHDKLYKLKTAQLKCAKCGKKFSPKKLELNYSIIESFCDEISAHKTSIALGVNYMTVKSRYDDFRKLVAKFAEDAYLNKEVVEYDEYLYLEQSKKKVEKNIFDAQNFLTFHYEDKVFNLPMPNLNKYKDDFLEDGADKSYFKELSKFMMFNKIAKIQNIDNLITRFWIFFEDSITKYKGIRPENFFYYLKEIEFKFNYTKEEQKEILARLYIAIHV